MAENKNAEGAEKPGEHKAGLDLDEKQMLLDRSKISLIIDNYDDIFSDFDSRPYSHRNLSDDFMYEAKRVSKEMKEGVAELRFMIPGIERDSNHEGVIKKRLKEHFRKHATILEHEIRKSHQRGAILAGGGFAMMIAATLLQVFERKDLLSTIAYVILEPAGWFTVWFGLDTIFYTSKDKSAELEFYSKMSKAEIIFEPF